MTRKKKTSQKKKTPARKAPPRVARKAPSGAEKARAAGAQYANDQVSSDYFADWVWEQLREASRMDPNTVLPLETEADARVIAKNMLKQLEWDTRRDLRASEIERLVGGGLTSPSCIDAFFDGFRSQLHESLDWLAEHVLEQGRGLRRDRVSETHRGRKTQMREDMPHPALIEALAADVNALRQERRISFEEAYDAITKPDWVRQYRGDKIDLENRIINKAKSIGRARGRISEARRRPVARGTARNRH